MPTVDPDWPSICLVEQTFERPRLADVVGTLNKQLAAANLGARVKPGQTVAVAVGSRGIRGIAPVVTTVVSALKGVGARPFIVPAMGSHGGGTSRGQLGVLEGYGITEQSAGCPLRATMDVIEIGQTPHGVPVMLDANAAGADHVVVINRVKPHTKFAGAIESGLVKMCLIGLGKQAGARIYHRAVARYGWMALAEPAYDIFLRRGRLCFGVAIVQNAYEDVASIRVVPADAVPHVEPQLLKQARALMPRLPFADIDLLVVDEMGKNISGTGMDTTVTGRKDGMQSDIARIFVRDLTQQTHGNAQGVGLADFTTRRLVDRIDFDALYLNSQTASRTDTCKIPMTFDTDRQALSTAIGMAGVAAPEQLRMVWIENTLQLQRLAVSAACMGDELPPGVSVLSAPRPLAFDAHDNLRSPFGSQPADTEAGIAQKGLGDAAA